MLKGWDDALAKDCLETAIKAWNDEKAHPTPNPAGGGFGGAAPAGAPGGGVLAASQGVVSGAQSGGNATGQQFWHDERTNSSAGRLGRGGFGVGTGLGGGSGIDHRHEWRRALQVPSEGVVPSDDHPAADGVRVVGRQSGHCLIWTRARKIKCGKR